MPATDSKSKTGVQREVPRGVVIGVFVVLALAIGAGVFYIANGGWKTESQKQYEWLHVTLPLKLARNGDKSMLNEENKLRKEHGQPPLKELPDTRDTSEQGFKKSQDVLWKALQGRKAQGGGTQ